MTGELYSYSKKVAHPKFQVQWPPSILPKEEGATVTGTSNKPFQLRLKPLSSHFACAWAKIVGVVDRRGQ